jgi:hypothetical protein
VAGNRSARRSSAAVHQPGASKARGAAIHYQYFITGQPTSPKLPHPSTTSPFNNTLHNRPPSPPHNQYFPPPPPQLSTADPKSPLDHHLQHVTWPTQYQATPPPKYHGNADPHKFLMSYEAAIASAGGDEATLTKSLIISLEDIAANWYSRLPPRCIHSWQQLKEKFLLNFQGFQAELNTKKDFLSCV